MKVNDIIVLDNDERYTLLKEVTYNGETYFMAVYVKDEKTLDENKIVFLKAVEDEDGQYVDIIMSEKLIYALTKEIKKNTDEK